MQIILLMIILQVLIVQSKYLEGELNTNEDWIFLARFCFLSEEGQFEYYIEYNDGQGEPNLLLYYDADDQWPAVYKSDKTCSEKESVLHTEQNQIINLTANYAFYRELSGCVQTPIIPTTAKPFYTISVPTAPNKNKKNTSTTTTTTTTTTSATTRSVAVTSSYDTTEFQFEMENYSTTEETSTSSFSHSSTTPNFNNIISKMTTTTERDLNLDFEELNDTYVKQQTNHRRTIIKRALTPTVAVKSKKIICRNARRFRSSRERWWFVAISNCNGTRGIHIKYKILMTNGPQGDYWHEHFSADEFYILPILMAFTVSYSFLLLAIIICSIELKSRQLLHTTYKLFVFSVIVQFFGIILTSMAYLKYAVNGVGAPNLKVVGALFMGTSETCFLLLLLLLAKGYTITRGRLPTSASVKLTIFMCIYVVMFIALFVYEAKVFDPGEVLYLYESPAGFGLIILRIMGWCMFIYSTIFTLKHYPEKSNFYYPFNIFGTLWFIAGPAFIISANTYIDKWVRESIVYAVLLFITFGGHLMFMILTMPSVANKNFPYHVRTTQIGVMEVNGSSTMERFNHHVYEQTSPNPDQTVIIPLTRRTTEEVFGNIYNQTLHSNVVVYSNSTNDNNRDVNRRQEEEDDLAMENVLGWSIAKNYNPLEVPVYKKNQQQLNISPNHSKFSDESSRRNSNGPESLNNLAQEVRGSFRDGFQDYVKDVPVELFTISKMVVNVPKQNNKT